jgi:hypothetical protein
MKGQNKADYICQGCTQKKPQNKVSECTKCGKILCNSCKGGTYCRRRKQLWTYNQ